MSGTLVRNNNGTKQEWVQDENGKWGWEEIPEYRLKPISGMEIMTIPYFRNLVKDSQKLGKEVVIDMNHVLVKESDSWYEHRYTKGQESIVQIFPNVEISNGAVVPREWLDEEGKYCGGTVVFPAQ